MAGVPLGAAILLFSSPPPQNKAVCHGGPQDTEPFLYGVISRRAGTQSRGTE